MRLFSSRRVCQSWKSLPPLCSGKCLTEAPWGVNMRTLIHSDQLSQRTQGAKGVAMSEVALTIRDRQRAIHGHVHGSEAERVIASLAAEPETIEELDQAMRRFTDRTAGSHFSFFRPGDAPEPWDAGWVVVDLAARVIAGESTYSAIATEGSAVAADCDDLVSYRLSDRWLAASGAESDGAIAERRRMIDADQPRIDVRQVLYGPAMRDFLVSRMAELRSCEAEDAVRQVHAEWLTTVRDDLGGLAPRDVMLADHKFMDFDLQYRAFQWSAAGRCPPGLDPGAAAYRHSGFGTHEIVLYYDLLRELLGSSRERLERQEALDHRDELLRLEELQQAWLESSAAGHFGRSPATLIDNQRRRIPEAGTGADAAVDPDCPCCQMMIEEMGPFFLHLDGSEMDDEFAFSFCRTYQEWQEEQERWEKLTREFEAEQARRREARDAAERIWTRTFADEELLDDAPLSQFVPVAMFGFAAMAGELNQDIRDLADDATGAAEQETLNRLMGNLRDALANSAELIDPTLERLINELDDLAERYPEVGEKCRDLSRRLQEFPEQLAASADRDDMPF